MLNRRTLLTTAGATVALATPLAGMAQGRKDAIVIGMALEPPGLDPTTGAAAAIAEVVQYNILETLTKINVELEWFERWVTKRPYTWEAAPERDADSAPSH